MNNDSYYTPRPLAETVVGYAQLREDGVIADFAAGEGVLLEESRKRWPHAQIVATDIDQTAVTRLRQRHPEWTVGRADLLANVSTNPCQALRRVKGKVTLLLLNPPFTCRGGSTREVLVDGTVFKSSTAIAFLLKSTQYLAPRGEIIVILPEGALYNRKDQSAWDHLRKRFLVKLMARWERGAFPNCSATSVVIKLVTASKAGMRERVVEPTPAPHCRAVAIIRGTYSPCVERRQELGPTLVHTTDLQGSKVILNGRLGGGSHRSVEGPAVLLPRVGRIRPEKIAVLPSRCKVMISDCVIGLKTPTSREANQLKTLLVRRYQELERCYVGTGAPHITLDRLRHVLGKFGLGVE